MKPISKLCLARRAAGLTQKELATRIGVSNETISAYERGARSLSLKTLYKIAKELNCDWRDLV